MPENIPDQCKITISSNAAAGLWGRLARYRSVRALRRAAAVAAAAAALGLGATTHGFESNSSDIWINEFHYDNSSTDTNEFLEVVAPDTFTNLNDLTLELYNGNGGSPYNSLTVDTFDLGQNVDGFNFYSITLPSNGIQNGGPDGLALDNNGTLLFALSYEGTFPGVGGVADGVNFTDIGESESSGTTATGSLGLEGFASTPGSPVYGDFEWTSFDPNSKGDINAGQDFNPTGPIPQTLTWDGGVSGTWEDAGAGWVEGATAETWDSSQPDSAVFDGASPTTVVVGNNVVVDDMSFSGANYSLSGDSIEIQGDVDVDASTTIDSDLEFSGAGNRRFDVAAGQTLTLGGTLPTTSSTLEINGDGDVQLTGDSTAAFSAADIRFEDSNATLTVAAGASSGLGQITSSPSGDETLAGDGTVDGSVNIFNGNVTGNLTFNSDAIVSGSIAPGDSSGTLTFNGGLQLFSTTYDWELSSLDDNASGSAGTNWDFIDVDGELFTTGGSQELNILYDGVPDPDSGDPFWDNDRTWTIASFTQAAVSGDQVDFDDGTLPDGFSLSTDANSVLLDWQANFTPPDPITADLAITEFMADPDGTFDSEGEWVEIYNYGTQTIDLTDWTLEDQDSDVTDLPSVSIAPNDFIVLANDTTTFIDEWLNGTDNGKVFQLDGFVSNSSDELLIVSPTGDVVWQLAYDGNAIPQDGIATFLADNPGLFTFYGEKGGDLIVGDGIDPATGSVGYSVSALSLSDPNSPFFDENGFSSVSGDFASPFALSSTGLIPEPATAALLAAGSLLLGRRRDRRRGC